MSKKSNSAIEIILAIDMSMEFAKLFRTLGGVARICDQAKRAKCHFSERIDLDRRQFTFRPSTAQMADSLLNVVEDFDLLKQTIVRLADRNLLPSLRLHFPKDLLIIIDSKTGGAL